MDNRTIEEVRKVRIGFPVEYEDEDNIVRNGLFLREPEIKELKRRLKEINKITDLKQQVKKQKEIIDDYKEDILNLLDIINKNCNELKCTSDEWLVIQKYQDKEASEWI